MTLDDLLNSLPADAVMAAAASDASMPCGCAELRSAVKARRDRRAVPEAKVEEWGEEIRAWMFAQEYWQGKAADVLAALVEEHPYEEDAIPGWMVEWWAPALHNPWHERLDEACDLGHQWLNGQ